MKQPVFRTASYAELDAELNEDKKPTKLISCPLCRDKSSNGCNMCMGKGYVFFALDEINRL